MSINFTAFNILMPLYGHCSTWVNFTQAKWMHPLLSESVRRFCIWCLFLFFFSEGRNLSYDPGSRFPITPSCLLESNRGGALLLRDRQTCEASAAHRYDVVTKCVCVGGGGGAVSQAGGYFTSSMWPAAVSSLMDEPLARRGCSLVLEFQNNT